MEEDAQIETATDLVIREVRRKKDVDGAALQKAFDIARDIQVPAEVCWNKMCLTLPFRVLMITRY
jgi:hypothetical protein